MPSAFRRVGQHITIQSGAVAQLGARVNGIHEVAGSIPASSTKPRGGFLILGERTRGLGVPKGARPLRGKHARGLALSQESVREVSDSNRRGSAVQSPPAPPYQPSVEPVALLGIIEPDATG